MERKESNQTNKNKTTPSEKLHESITGFGCTHYSHLECCAAHPPF